MKKSLASRSLPTYDMNLLLCGKFLRALFVGVK